MNNALLTLEVMEDITAIMAETDTKAAARLIAALQLRLEEELQGKGDGEAELHARIASEKVQDAWVSLQNAVRRP